MTIRTEFSRIVKFAIPKNRWDESFATLNRENVIGNKEILQMILVIAKRLEAMEAQEE